jgi:two-component system, NarL family, sensor kinase
MKTTPGQLTSQPARSRELAELRVRLAEAEETLHAIRTGEVDAVVSAGKEGLRVFTLEGAGHAYRLLIESMNEGALTLTTDKMIVYANQCFARMVRCPLGQVMGSSFRRFLSAADQATLRSLLKRVSPSGSKIQVQLHASDGSQMPVQISIRPAAKEGSHGATIGMVVTDLTDARRTEELLRALSHRLLQVQEAERGHVALELHDRLTQLHCAILFRSQALADKLSARDEPLKREAMQLCELAGKAAKEVERISGNLRPSVLDQMGLVAIMRATTTEFADQAGLSVKLACVELSARLPADTELALYRILQEALKNVEQHARARHVTVQLAKQDALVLLTIKDDGIGFDPEPRSAGRKRNGHLGLLGMRERATSVGGTLTIKSARRAGTEIEVRVPLPPRATAPC